MLHVSKIRVCFSSFVCNKTHLKWTPTLETSSFWKPCKKVLLCPLSQDTHARDSDVLESLKERQPLFHCGLPFVLFFAQEEIQKEVMLHVSKVSVLLLFL